LEEDDEYDPAEATQMSQKPTSHSQQQNTTAQTEGQVKFWLEEDDIGEF
jgi:hypothetical protein